MKQPHLSIAIAGLCFGFYSNVSGQVSVVVRPEPLDSCNTGAPPDPPEHHSFLHDVQITGGQLTIPFKIRPKPEHGTFRLTTDVTLGAYIGATKRLSKTKDHYLTIPFTAGLTFINLNQDNTTLDLMAASEGGNDVVPGLSWSTGLIIQLEKMNFGIIVGKDYASEVGNQWAYHRKWWWSFGIGFSFVQD